MENFNSHMPSSSLKISSDVIEKIAHQATLEVSGVADVVPYANEGQALKDRFIQRKPVSVEVKNDVADIEVSIMVNYGSKIPELSEKIQKNVKDAVQGMTSISVANVDVIVAGLAADSLPTGVEE